MANWSFAAVVALIMEILGCIFTIVSLSTSYWGKLDETFIDSGLTSKTISGHWGMFEICRTTDLDNFVSTSCVSTSSGVSDHWTTAMVFEILAFVASFLVILPWILWIMYADILDIFPWSMWLRATTIAMLYITALCHGVAVAIWYLHEVSPYRIRGIEFQTGWSWTIAVYCLIWEILAVIPVVFSRLSDKHGYDDLFWVYPPDFVLKAEKKNLFYKFWASFCLRLRFDNDSRVRPIDEPDPLIPRRPPSASDLFSRRRSSTSSSIELHKNTEFEHSQMNLDEAPPDETRGINDKYLAEVEPEADGSLRPEVKEEEYEENFEELQPNKEGEEECDDDFKEVLFTNKPEEITDGGSTHDIVNSALEKDNHLEVSEDKVQTEENEVTNELHSIVVASTPNDCTELIESESDDKRDIDEQGDDNVDHKLEASTEKMDTESLKVDKNDHLNKIFDEIFDTDKEKDKIEEQTEMIPVQVPLTVDNEDISEKKDKAVGDAKEEKEGKGARRKHAKKKVKKKRKKANQKEKPATNPVPQQDFASVVQSIIKPEDNIKEESQNKKKNEETTPNMLESDTLKPASYLWRRLSKSIVRDFRQMQNNNNAHRSEEGDIGRNEDMKNDPHQLREDLSNESENKKSNENYEDSQGLLPEKSDTLPEICVIMPEEEPEDAAWKAEYEALIGETEENPEPDVFNKPDEETSSAEENTVENSGYRPKKMKPAWTNPLDLYKSQAVNAELSSPENKALQKAYSKKPPPQLPTPESKIEMKESIFSLGSIPAIDI